MSNPPAAPATAFPIDAQDQARLRNSYVGQLLRRSQLWQRPQFQRVVEHFPGGDGVYRGTKIELPDGQAPLPAPV